VSVLSAILLKVESKMTKQMETANWVALDKQTLFHPFSSIQDLQNNGTTVMSSGRGLTLVDSNGKEYLDAMAGLWCCNVGYGREEIIEAITKQSRQFSYFHGFNSNISDTAIECAEKVLSVAPGNMSKIFFGCSGSDGNETNLKIIWFYNNLRGKPEKKKILSRMGSYHGSGVASGSLSGLPSMHQNFNMPISGDFLYVERPLYYRDAPAGMSEREFSKYLARKLEERILQEGPETVAAFFCEPLMGAGGLIPMPEGYFEEVQPILKKYDVLLVADEVITGYGRLGTYWGSDSVGMQPDIMTTAKGITSGYFPLSASLISKDIWDVIANDKTAATVFSHGFTYSAHPVAAAAALANLKIIEEEGLVENARNMGAYLHSLLRETIADHPLVGSVRGYGLIGGIELVENKQTKAQFAPEKRMGRQLYNIMFNEGMVSRVLGDTVVFAPALTINKDQVDRMVATFAKGIDLLAKKIKQS